MSTVHEDEAISDLLGIKSKLEESISHLHDEKENIRKKILSIKEQKDMFRKIKAEELQKLYKLKIELVDSNKRLQDDSNHVLAVNQTVTNLEQSIHDQVKLVDFEKKIMEMQSSLEGAINFYNEDSLQMELMKRVNNVREQRVAYTKAETDHKELLKRIEDEKREKERIKQAQLEKERLEEEEIKRQEESKIKADEAIRREEFLRSRAETAQQPFLGKIQPPASPLKLNSVSEPSDEPEATDSKVSTVENPKNNPFNQDISFSQLLRW